MLKTLSTKSTDPRKGILRVGDNNKAECDRSKIVNNEFDDEFEDKIGKQSWNPFKSKNLSKSKKTDLDFLSSGARMAFTELRQAFIKAPIFYHFDLKDLIWVETNVSGYTIGGGLS